MQKKISATIITYNEETNISRCIKSLLPVADEIIVVDSFSTDRTKEICQSLGVKFIEHNFEGYYQQKNFANTLASNEFILSLDADEHLSETLISSILIEKQNELSGAYSFNRLNLIGNRTIKSCGLYPDRKLRLWNAKIGEWSHNNPHEKVIVEKNTTIKKLKGDLIHHTAKNIEEFLNTQYKYAELWAQFNREKNSQIAFSNPILKSTWKFFKCFILKYGFIDGFSGFKISIGIAKATYHKYNYYRNLS